MSQIENCQNCNEDSLHCSCYEFNPKIKLTKEFTDLLGEAWVNGQEGKIYIDTICEELEPLVPKGDT